MGWITALAVIIGLVCLPLGASVVYDEDGPMVRIVAGPLKIKVFPRKKKPKKEKKPKKPKKGKKAEPSVETAQTPEKKPAPKQKKGGALLDFLPLVKVALELLNDLRCKLRVDHLKLHLTLGGGDPADLAINYGRMNASLAGLIAQLERFLIIKKRDVHIDCDFTADQNVILARLDLTITVGRLLCIAVRYGIRALITFLNIKKQQEGGADL